MDKDDGLFTTVVGSWPLSNNHENMLRVFKDLIQIGVDYPCYPQLLDMNYQFLSPLSQRVPQLDEINDKFYLIDDFELPKQSFALEYGKFIENFLNDNPNLKTTISSVEEGEYKVESLESLSSLDQTLREKMENESVISSFKIGSLSLAMTRPMFPLMYHKTISDYIISNMEKIAPRTRSVAGRVVVPFGNFSWCPFALPAITRISSIKYLQIKVHSGNV